MMTSTQAQGPGEIISRRVPGILSEIPGRNHAIMDGASSESAPSRETPFELPVRRFLPQPDLRFETSHHFARLAALDLPASVALFTSLRCPVRTS